MNKAEQMKHLKDIFQGFLIAFCLLNLEGNKSLYFFY